MGQVPEDMKRTFKDALQGNFDLSNGIRASIAGAMAEQTYKIAVAIQIRWKHRSTRS